MKIPTTMTALTSTAYSAFTTSIASITTLASMTVLTAFMTRLTALIAAFMTRLTAFITTLTSIATLTACMTLLIFSDSAQAAQQANKLIDLDRYTVLNPIQTPAQADPLSVIISIKFAKSVVSVKQAIEQLLRQSGYSLSKNYELEKINSFTLPKVHQELGPMSLKRMIKVLLGPAWDLSVDQTTRSIQIVQTDSHALQVLTPDTKTLLKGVITPSVLDEVVVVSINNNLLLLALEKILPKGWRVVLSDDSQDLAIKTVSVVSEDSKRAVVIKKILTDIGAQGFFYKKLKLLVVRSHQEIIK